MSEISREEIAAYVAQFCRDATQRDSINRYLEEIIPLRSRLRHAEGNNAQLARHRRAGDLDAESRALVESLRETLARQDLQIARLKTELAEAYRNNARRNRELDALHYVWCDGGCEGGVHRYDGDAAAITEEIVALAERNTKRLRRWFVNHQLRQRREEKR